MKKLVASLLLLFAGTVGYSQPVVSQNDKIDIACTTQYTNNDCQVSVRINLDNEALVVYVGNDPHYYHPDFGLTMQVPNYLTGEFVLVNGEVSLSQLANLGVQFAFVKKNTSCFMFFAYPTCWDRN